MRFPLNTNRRRGALIPLFALLLIPLLAMLAFSIDAGWMVLVRTDLQNTADAAALAGVEKLQNLYVQYYSPGQLAQGTILTRATTNSGTDSPMGTAEKFAALNKAGNVNITLLDQDVTFGFTDAQGKYTSPYLLGFPNTIQVVVRRDDVANGPLNLFFAKVLGISSMNITATARATIYSGAVSSLQSLPGVSAHVLPVALDYKIWDTFYKTGQSPDGLIHLNPSNDTPQLQVYPYPGNAPGSFGLVDTGPPANSIPAFKNWIDNGQTPNDISYLLNNNMLPVSMDAPKQWKVGPGFKDSMQADFASQIGLPNLIPLFKAVQYPSTGLPLLGGLLNTTTYQAASGTGQSATYAIVGFIGVTVSQVSANGNPLVVNIQPMAVVDPNAVIQTLSPAGTQVFPLTPSVLTNTTITTFGSAKLTN
jgi:Putative Flp pilus-assembly TadE/G-like